MRCNSISCEPPPSRGPGGIGLFRVDSKLVLLYNKAGIKNEALVEYLDFILIIPSNDQYSLNKIQ
jgi:hypothetical protein